MRSVAYVHGGIAATTNTTVHVTYPLKVLIIDASVFMVLPVLLAFFRAQTVQLVSRVKVARVAVGARIARIKNTKPPQMNKTVGIAMTA